MNIEVANALYGYFESLYCINCNIIKLCGVDIYCNNDEAIKITLEIIRELPRVIPYAYDSKQQKVVISNRNGLMEFKDEIIYLEEDYNKILDSNEVCINKIRLIRNKYEHKMHGVRYDSSGCGTKWLFNIWFRVGDEEIEINASEFVCLIGRLNELFKKIVQEICDYAILNDKTEYPYYNKLTRFDFLDFNKIYEDKNLRIIGKMMYNF